MGGPVSSAAFAGGLIPLQNWYAPSLTSNKEAGLGDWENQRHRRSAEDRRVEPRRGVRSDG